MILAAAEIEKVVTTGRKALLDDVDLSLELLEDVHRLKEGRRLTVPKKLSEPPRLSQRQGTEHRPQRHENASKAPARWKG